MLDWCFYHKKQCRSQTSGGPTKNCVAGGGGEMDERNDEMHLSVFHSV